MIDENKLIEKLKESGLDDSEDKWLLNFVINLIEEVKNEEKVL